MKFPISALFLISTLLLGISLRGQSSKIIKGKISAKDKDVTGIVVQNITNDKATITDLDGNFSILVFVNDTLIFSAVQFKRKVLPITREIYDSSFLTIVLKEFVNELEEVVVKPYNLSGNLEKDLNDLKLEKDISAKELGLPNSDVRVISQNENRLYDADHGKFIYVSLGLAINVNKILNRISGRTKALQKRVTLDKRYATTQKVEAAFVDSVLISHLKIPKNSLSVSQN